MQVAKPQLLGLYPRQTFSQLRDPVNSWASHREKLVLKTFSERFAGIPE
jgi:hypothetical protein